MRQEEQAEQQQEQAEQQQEQVEQQQEQAAGQPATPPVDLNGGGYIDRVLLRVNGEPILQSDLEEQWEYIQPGLQGLPREQLQAQEPEIRKAVVAQMADNLLLMQRADEMGISASTNQIDRAVARVMQQQGLSSEEELEQALAASGMTLAEMREQFAERIVQQTLIYQEIQPQLFVSEAEIQRYYEEHVDEFTQPAEVMFQQAFFVVEEGNRASARQAAESALADLQGGASLAAIGERYPGVRIQEGGDWVTLEDLRPELAAMIEGLAIGDYELVETPLAFHIVQVINRRDTRVQPFEEVSREVRNILLRQREEAATAEYTDRLRESAYIEVMAPEYRSLVEDWENARATSVTGRQRR